MLGFLTDGKRVIKLDKRYDHHYDFLQKELDMDVASLFYLCFLIGYTTGSKKANYIPGRKQFRTSYLSEEQRAVLYTISEEISDYKLFKNLTDQEIIGVIIKDFQLYSSKGMEILLEEVFSKQLTNDQLNHSYKNYEFDLMCYLYDRLSSVPF